ncbi:hypothetical protein [Naumannella huperziae]
MALAAAIGTGSAYPLQPAMADVADALNSTIGAIGSPSPPHPSAT